MKQQVITLMSQLKEWFALGIAYAKSFIKDWPKQIVTYQNQLYELTHHWFTSNTPWLAERYDRFPPLLRKGFFYLLFFNKNSLKLI